MSRPPRGVRNRNPGNIRATSDRWQGMTGVDADGFVIFDRPQNGIRAMGKVLRSYHERHGLRTVAEIISRYAPADENDTAAYTATVAERLGLAPDEPIPWPERVPELVAAMIRVELGDELSAWWKGTVLWEGLHAAGYPVVPGAEGLV